MDIEQAQKLLAEIEQEEKNGKMTFDKIDKFLIELIELLNFQKFSQANINLFSNQVNCYFRAKNVDSLSSTLHYAKIYISIMNEPSMYENNPVKPE
ncbi:MAG: hypothetical protein M1308_23585 [Actinobacteria bacterium]|nr:hypothetical protein [Actinomycetota bacterium]